MYASVILSEAKDLYWETRFLATLGMTNLSHLLIHPTGSAPGAGLNCDDEPGKLITDSSKRAK